MAAIPTICRQSNIIKSGIKNLNSLKRLSSFTGRTDFSQSNYILNLTRCIGSHGFGKTNYYGHSNYVFHFARSLTTDGEKTASQSTQPPTEEKEEDRKKREQSWKTMKYTFVAFGATFGFMGMYMVYELGSPKKDEEGNIIPDEFSDLPALQQFFQRTLKECDYYKRMIREPSREKLLPDPVVYPYLQPPYTLVLELKDVLVHPDWTYKTGWRFKKRPGVDKFLEEVAPPLFEVVIFTADQGLTVFPILDALDPNGYIMYRLVRDATHFVDGHHVKDLDCLNRDLKKVIVIDWDKDSVKFHRRNTFLLRRWKGNDDDQTLTTLGAFLRTIANENIEDVREVLDYYSQFDDPVEAFRINQLKVLEELENSEKQRDASRKHSLTKHWSSVLLSKH